MKDSDFKGAADDFVESKSIKLQPTSSVYSSAITKLNNLESPSSNDSSTLPKLHEWVPNCSNSSTAALNRNVLEQTCAENSSLNGLHPTCSNYTTEEVKGTDPERVISDQHLKFSKLKLETSINSNNFDPQRNIQSLDSFSSDFVALGNPPSYNDVVYSSSQLSKKPINDFMSTSPNNISVSAQPQKNIPKTSFHFKPDSLQGFRCGPYEVSTGSSSAFRFQGNAIYQSTINSDNNGFEDSASPAYCGTCKITVLTVTSITYKPSAYLCCFIMFFSGICCPLSYVPFLFCGPRKVFHACPQCKNVLGIYIDK